MNTEERLKQAEELLRELKDTILDIWEYEIVEKVNSFLNPEINWSKVPIGTHIVGEDGSWYYYTGDVKHADANFTIPPQISHVHKSPWPTDGEQPDWVKDEDLIWSRDKDGNDFGPYFAKTIVWASTRKWFAALRLTDYRSDFE